VYLARGKVRRKIAQVERKTFALMQFVKVATNGKLSSLLGDTSVGVPAGILSIVARCKLYIDLSVIQCQIDWKNEKMPQHER